jgi:hypothetical protein
MSKLALVSLDLHNAHPRYYPKIEADLARLGLQKKIRSRKSGKRGVLPANTYVARFGSKWAQKSAADLRNHLRKLIRKILRTLGLRATIFVTVADNWAWSRRTV